MIPLPASFFRAVPEQTALAAVSSEQRDHTVDSHTRHPRSFPDHWSPRRGRGGEMCVLSTHKDRGIPDSKD